MSHPLQKLAGFSIPFLRDRTAPETKVSLQDILKTQSKFRETMAEIQKELKRNLTTLRRAQGNAKKETSIAKLNNIHVPTGNPSLTVSSAQTAPLLRQENPTKLINRLVHLPVPTEEMTYTVPEGTHIPTIEELEELFDKPQVNQGILSEENIEELEELCKQPNVEQSSPIENIEEQFQKICLELDAAEAHHSTTPPADPTRLSIEETFEQLRRRSVKEAPTPSLFAPPATEHTQGKKENPSSSIDLEELALDIPTPEGKTNNKLPTNEGDDDTSDDEYKDFPDTDPSSTKENPLESTVLATSTPTAPVTTSAASTTGKVLNWVGSFFGGRPN